MNKPVGHIKETNLQLIVSFHRSDTDVTGKGFHWVFQASTSENKWSHVVFVVYVSGTIKNNFRRQWMSPCIRFFVEVLIAFQRAPVISVLHARRFGERFTGDLALTISSLLVPPLSLTCTVQGLTFAGVHRCAANPLTPKSVSHLISPYHITPESKNWGQENKGADHPLEKLLIVRQENPGVLPGGFRWDPSGVQRAPPNLAWQDYLSVTGYLFRNAKFPISILVRSLWESHVDARRIPAESQRVAKSFRTGYFFRDPKSTL